MNNTLILLTTLTKLLPPSSPARHGITMTDDGKLQVNILLGATWQSFILDDADLAKDPLVLATEIADLVASIP